MIRHAVRQPVSVVVGVALLLLAGIVTLARLPIQLAPTVDTTVITVNTFWEGASPSEIEQDVLDEQEERLIGVSGLRLLTSTASQSSGAIRMEFQTGVSKDEAMREVVQRLNEVSAYPEGVDNPVVEASDPENRDYIAWIVLGTDDPDFDIRTLRDFAKDRIEPYLENVPGIAEINVLGGTEAEVQVRVDPVRLAQRGITPSRFADAIRATNRNLSAGQVPDGKRDVRVRTIGQFDTVEALGAAVVAHSGGVPVRVRDVAEVALTYKEPAGFVHSRGRPVIAINADRELGSNVIQVMRALKEAIAELNAPGGLLEAEARRIGLSGTLSLTQVYDQTLYVEQAVDLVRSNIWFGGALAVVVLLLFLRSVRPIIIIGLAIPISVIGGVVGMVALGRTVNVISLAGMAFAVGMVVDNAIVVLENIFRHLEMGKTPFAAALDGTREVWGAVLASTLTTIVVFVPILLVQQEAGQLFRDIAVAICVAIGLSMVVSITVIPCAAARLLGRHDEAAVVARHGRTRTQRVVERLCRGWVLRPALIVLLTALSVVGTIKLRPPADYLPRGNRNLIFGIILPPPGYNQAQYERIAERVEAVVRPYWEARGDADLAAALPSVPTFDWMTRSPGPPVQPPPIENYFIVQFGNVLFHGAISGDPSRTVDILPLFSHATRAEVLPGTIAFPFQVPLFQLGGSSGSAVKLQLLGSDLEEVLATAGTLYPQLAGRYGWGAVQPNPGNFTIRVPELQVRPDLVRLGELGLDVRDVGLAVAAFGDGAIVDDFAVGGKSIDLRVVAAGALERGAAEGLGDLPVATPAGVVPLRSIADIRYVNEPQEIARVRRLRAVTFEITPPEGVALEALVAELEETIRQGREAGTIPPGISSAIEGTAGKLKEVRTALIGDGGFVSTVGSAMVLALLVVYLLMCVLFQSFVQPLVIMFSVPLATLGGFLGLFAVFIWSVSDRLMPMQSLDVLTMLGFVLLVGVVVNNAILIVHQSLNFMRGEAELDGEQRRLEPREAIAAAVRTRVRPIFMSTLTSVGGMLPLVLMPGAGSELYRGLGGVVVGGLLVSTIFTLLLVPLVLSVVFDLFGAPASVREAR